jgi:hypothetical protein
MKTKWNLIIGSVLVLIIVVFGIVLVSKSRYLTIQTNMTQKEKSQKDSLRNVLRNQVIAQEMAKALAEQQVKSRTNLLQSSGLSNLQFPGIYWQWMADSAVIEAGIKTFKLYDTERDDYVDYKWSIQQLIQETFGGDYYESQSRSDALINLFIRVPNFFKVIYDLNKGIVGNLKTSWELPNQGEELAKYLGSKYPYEGDFEAYFQTHVRDSLTVFSEEVWQKLDSLCQKRYPEIFKSEKDTKREYGNWRVVRANLSPESKAVLLYVLTDYNGGVSPQSATVTKSKSISDWFK